MSKQNVIGQSKINFVIQLYDVLSKIEIKKKIFINNMLLTEVYMQVVLIFLTSCLCANESKKKTM
jgi:hypothetical protein